MSLLQLCALTRSIIGRKLAEVDTCLHSFLSSSHKWGFCTEICLFPFHCVLFLLFLVPDIFKRCFLFCFFCFLSVHDDTLLACSLVNLEYNELSGWLWCKKLPLFIMSLYCIIVNHWECFKIQTWQIQQTKEKSKQIFVIKCLSYLTR